MLRFPLSTIRSFAARSHEGAFDRFVRSSAPVLTPVTEPFPAVAAALGSAVPATGGATGKTTGVTTLPNGVRVSTENTPNSAPYSSVAVYVRGGSRYEDDSNSGATHFLEQMAFRSTLTRSDIALQRDAENAGVALSATASREGHVYFADALTDKVPVALSAVADTIAEPAFNKQEMSDALRSTLQGSARTAESPDLSVNERFHGAAFSGRTIGRPYFCTADSGIVSNPEGLAEYRARFFTGDNIVVAAAGVDHDEFVSQVAEAFENVSPGGGEFEGEAAVYSGGSDIRAGGDSSNGLAHVIVGYESCGWHSPDLIGSFVLHQLMGGGGSFSAGGPGKGMYSRIYTNVLNQFNWVYSANTFNTAYNDTGLFGIYGTVEGSAAPDLVKVLEEQMKSMSSDITEEECVRAKKQVIASLFFNLETRPVGAEDVARQIATYGKRHSAADVVAQIEALSLSDIRTLAGKITSTPKTIAAVGNVSSLPLYG